MATLRAAHYSENEERLMQCPIVIAMAQSIPTEQIKAECLHDNGQPNYTFMMAAGNEYKNRGGEDAQSIGAVAHALLRLKGLE